MNKLFSVLKRAAGKESPVKVKSTNAIDSFPEDSKDIAHLAIRFGAVPQAVGYVGYSASTRGWDWRETASNLARIVPGWSTTMFKGEVLLMKGFDSGEDAGMPDSWDEE